MIPGLPEPLFRLIWIRTLTAAMQKTGKGFRLNAISRHTGKTYWAGDDWCEDRRPDKLVKNRPPKWLRQLQASTRRG